MTTSSPTGDQDRPGSAWEDVRLPKLAELVADHFREEILRGSLRDGELLPKAEDLRESFAVSKPSFREAMRILETEGLITIRRGNVGGIVVHRPSVANVAYSLAMVLSARSARIDEVARALRECEPACAALCAERRDRHRAVLSRLRSIQRDSRRSVDDLVAATMASRRFHEALVDCCGNEPLIAMVGALESIWSSHETGWAHRVRDAESVPIKERQSAFDLHEEIIELIVAGTSDRVRQLCVSHLEVAQRYPKAEVDVIDPKRVRRWRSAANARGYAEPERRG